MKFARTSITATVGPASSDVGVLTAMARAGANVFRLNGAHTKAAELAPWVEKIHAAGDAAGRTIAVMVDLPGIKLRTGLPVDDRPVELVAGERVTLCGGRRGTTAKRIHVYPWPDITGVKKGTTVLLDDGRLRLRVLRRRGEELTAEVEEGGVLEPRKGVAFPGVRIDLPVPTRRDRELARAAIEAGADWLALSFVGSAADLKRLRRVTQRATSAWIPVAAKIERDSAIPHLEAILEESAAVMVARGDLGTDVGGENVPALQKRIVEAAHEAGRPALIATEMLDSMTHRARPTRAEVSDVAGAVFEGTDGVLLSGETAVGVDPARAVATMTRILRTAEDDVHARYAGDPLVRTPRSRPDRPDQHVVHAAVELASETDARSIVVFTRSGASAIRLSKERPRARIHALSPSAAVCRRLSLAWGVTSQYLPAARGTDEVIERVARGLRDPMGLAPGERAVLVMGGATDPAGATTLIKLLTA
ncbi:MAG: pyruvate kinase [Planctomycetota bacterium]|nr:pyruvate kinase [Planctomycetota bacterium]